MIEKFRLLQNAEIFTKDWLQRRADLYGFTQLKILELFAWNLEIISQLQSVSDELILKGGAATQLYLPVEKQRGSIDVDIITALDTVENVFGELNSRFSAFSPLFQFRSYRPKKPSVNLPMHTYDILVPSTTAVRDATLAIKVDILSAQEPLPMMRIKHAETFVAGISDVRCLTPGALIGDKILTLAKGSVGMRRDEDYPKQIYDLEMLVFQNPNLSKTAFAEAGEAASKLVPLEAGFRQIATTPGEALENVKETMNTYSFLGFRIGDMALKSNINNFQQFYVSKAQMETRMYEWSSRALRIRFLASLMQELLSGRINAQKALDAVKDALDFAVKLRSPGKEDTEPRGELLKLLPLHYPAFKELRQGPMDRIFWQVLTPDNLKEIKEMIS